MKGTGGGGFEALLKGTAPATGPKQLKGLNLRKGSHSKPPAQLHPSSYAASSDTSDGVEPSVGKGGAEAAAEDSANLAVSALDVHGEESEHLPAAAAMSQNGDPGTAQKSNSRQEQHTAEREGAAAVRISTRSEAEAPQDFDRLPGSLESAPKLALKPDAAAQQSPVQAQGNALQNGATTIIAAGPQSMPGLHPADSSANNPDENKGPTSTAEAAAQPPPAGEEEAAAEGLPRIGLEAQNGHVGLSPGKLAAASAHGQESIAAGVAHELSGRGREAIEQKELGAKERDADLQDDEPVCAGADAANGARSGVQSARAFWEALGDEPAQRTDDPAPRPRGRLSKSPRSFSGSDGGSQSRPASAAPSAADQSCSDSGYSRPGSAGANSSPPTSDKGTTGGLQSSRQADVDGVSGADVLAAQARDEKEDQRDRSSGDPTAALYGASEGGREHEREDKGGQSTSVGTASEGHTQSSAAQPPAAGAHENAVAAENPPAALVSAASAELPVSTMPSSTSVHPDMYPLPEQPRAEATAALSPRQPENLSSAHGAEDADSCTVLSAAQPGGRTDAQALEVSSGPQPESRANPGDAEPGSRQEPSKPPTPISVPAGDAERLAGAVHEARQSVGGAEGVFAEMPEALSGPILEAFKDGNSESGQTHSMSAERLPSVSSSGALHANTESTEVVERSEVGSVVDSDMAEDGLEDRQQPAGVPAESSASLTDLRRATPAGETSGAAGEHDAVWAKRPKHMFVLSNAGKPIFTLHGDGNELAGFMAVIHAMLSFASERGDPLRSLRAGRHQVVFLVKGPLYLVAVSAQGEPAGVLRLQLETLHAQIVCILTTGFERMFARNPRYDSRRLLGGTDSVLRGLIEGFDNDPSALLGAFPPLPISPGVRHACLVSLQAAVKASEALYGLILVGDLVLALTQPRAHPFAPTNLLLLSNFVRTTSVGVAESFTPVCLPHFNPSAFLHAYIHYLNQDAEVCLILLASEQDSFYRLAEAGHTLAKELTSSGALQEVAKVARQREGMGRILIRDLPQSAGGGAPGSTPLLHFLYKSPARGQFIMPAFTGALTDDGFRKGVMAAYARVHSAMFAEPTSAQGAPHATQRVHFTQNDFCTVMAFVGSEYELFAAFDALAEKPRALGICQRLCAWVKNSQATLFMPL